MIFLEHKERIMKEKSKLKGSNIFSESKGDKEGADPASQGSQEPRKTGKDGI